MAQSDSNIERKTDQKSQNPSGESNQMQRSKVEKVILPNLLNNYRNVTYSFTISAVPDDWLESVAGTPPKYRTEPPKFVILKSGGKGTKNFALPDKLSKVQKSSIEAEVNAQAQRLNSNLPLTDFVAQETVAQQSLQLDVNKGIIEGFNKDSPGRYDMYIDDVEIQGVMTPGTLNGASLATKLSFSVVEPYSINGFIEALHAASIAAGYLTYASGAFLMTIEFWGYRDDVDVSQSTPEIIQKSTKYLLFSFSSVKVELTERGTRYNCTAVMFTDRILGNPSKLKIPNNAEGKTVKEILENLFANLNKQKLDSDNESKPGTSKIGDKYFIKFPNVKNDGTYEFTEKGNAIGASEMFDFNKENANQAMPDPAKTNKGTPRNDKQTPPKPETVKKDPNIEKYTPDGNGKFHFNAGKNLNECIESVVVNSKYVQNILKNFKPDKYGLINYFIIIPEVTNQEEFNPQTKEHYKNYTFIVKEYRVHYTRVPGYASIKFDVNSITKLINKEYNYTYTGKNIDVLNFKIDFNNLYFESIPFALANNEMIGVRNAFVKDNSPKVENKPENTNKIAADSNPVQRTLTDIVDINPPGVGTAGPTTENPYQILARNMHEAIINAGVSGATGTLEILGDPFFISTTGTGNYTAKLKEGTFNVTTDEEINATFGEVYIMVIFRNPVDVNEFDKKRVPFSGVYIITNVNSSFKSGIFKQDLKLIRIPAQIPVEDNIPASDPTKVSVTTPNPNNQVVPDTTPAVSGPGLRPDPTQLSIPTVNNPLYNIAGQGLNAIKQGVSQLGAASSVFSLPQSRLSEGIRLASLAINTPLQSLAALKSTGEQLGSAVGDKLTGVKNTLETFVGQSPLAKIVGGTNKTGDLINGFKDKLPGVSQEQLLSDLASTLGINPNNLSLLDKEKLQGLKTKAQELSVNIPRAAAAGIKLDNIPLDKLQNIPTLAPPSVAPDAEVPLKDLQGLDIARAFGVTSLDKLPGGITPDKINTAIAAGTGIAGKLLSIKQPLSTDLSAVKDKFDAAANQAFGALKQSGQSIESSQSSLGTLNKVSVASLFKSKSTNSPLDKLITTPESDITSGGGGP